MKHTRKLISLLTLVAFLVMALVPMAALAEDSPTAPAETEAAKTIGGVTLTGIETPETGATPTPNGDIAAADVAAFATATAAAENAGDSGDPSDTTRAGDEPEAIEGAFSAANVAWSAVTSAGAREGETEVTEFEANTQYKAVVTLTLVPEKAALPESISDVKVTLNSTADGDSGVEGQARAADDPEIVPSAGENDTLVITITYPATEAGETILPTIGEIVVPVLAPQAGRYPQPPTGDDMAQYVRAMEAPAAEGDGDTQDPGAASREDSTPPIEGAFSAGTITWSEVSAETEQEVTVFKENTQYQAVVTLTLDPENAVLPEDISVKLDPDTDATITTTRLDEDPAVLEITIVFPETGEDDLKMEYAPTYGISAVKPWIQWYAGDSTMPTLQARLAGPGPVENKVYTWSAGAGDSAQPIDGVTGPELTLPSELLGSDPGIKTFTVSGTATRDGQKIELGSAVFSVLVAPEGGITLFCPTSPKPSYGYLVGKSSAPSMDVSAIGATEGVDLTYAWTDEAGNKVGTGKTFTPSAAQLGSVRDKKVFKCEVSSSGDVKVYENPLEYTVDVYVNDLNIIGPSTVRAGSTIDITVSAPGLLAVTGKVNVSGLQVTKVESKLTPSASDDVSQIPELGDTYQMSDAENVVLLSAWHTEAVYTCRVTASAGHTVSFSLSDVNTTDGANDIGINNVSWSRSIPGNTPVNPGGSSGGGGGAVIAPNPTPSPSPTPSSAPTETPAPTATAVPTAPVQLAPDAPDSMQIEANPDGPGTILTGVEISTPQDTFNVAALERLIRVPEGGSVVIRDADGAQAPVNARVATGMVVQVRDSAGNTIEQSQIVVPGDVNGTGLMNLSQVITMAKALTGQKPLTGVYRLAGDLDSNGRITITDVVVIAKMFVAMGMTVRS